MGSKAKYKSEDKYNKIERKDLIILGIAVLTVFIVSIWYLRQNYSLKVWGDEFGYWQSAAFLTGKDWSSVASTNSYYGFGFGILLAPIMLIFGQNATLMMQVALVFEALMLASCVVAAYLCVGYFNNKLNGFLKVLFALVPIVYPSNILYVNLTMAEILIVALIWWYTYAVLRFVKEKKFCQAIIIMVMSVYMYSVHQRTIAIMLISLALIAWVYRKQLLTPKSFIILGVLGGGLIAVLLFKNIYTANMYSQASEASYNANNLAGQGDKISNILTSLDGFLKFLQSVVGKFYYISVGSLMLAALGMVKCVQICWKCFKEKRELDWMGGVLVILLNYLAAHLIGSIYMSDGYGYRTDILIYGRYIEHSIGPLVLLGILYLYEICDLKVILSTMSLTTLAAVMAANTIEYRASNSNIWANCSAIADLFNDTRYTNAEEIYTALFRSCIFLLVLFFSLHFKKYLKEWGFATVLVSICITWISIGYEIRNEKVIPWADELYHQQAQVLEYIEEEEFGLYQSHIGGFFQFMRVNSTVKHFDKIEQIEEYSKPMYIITYTGAEDIWDIREEQEIIFENDMYVLWRSSVN